MFNQKEIEREIIIVGAGPTGSTAAIAVSQQGHDVLLIDRQTFPRDKTCGDGVPMGATEVLYKLGMKDLFDQADFYPIDTVQLVSPTGYIYENQLKKGENGAQAHVIPRLQFDDLLQKRAVQVGAEFCQAKVKEPIIENGTVKGVRVDCNGRMQEIHAKLVLAADGATSVISRALRPQPQPDSHRAIALRGYIEGFEVLPHQVEFYMHQDVLPGYAWIFPLGANQANIGLGMRLDKFRQQKRTLNEMLDTFLALPFIKDRIHDGSCVDHIATWQLPFGSEKRIQRAYDGAMLLGDAGWLIDPLTGGGIENGMMSAMLAAQTAHQALQQGDVSRKILQAYEQACRAVLWPSLRRSTYIQRSIMQYPRLLDWLFKYARNHPHLAQVFMAKL